MCARGPRAVISDAGRRHAEAGRHSKTPTEVVPLRTNAGRGHWAWDLNAGDLVEADNLYEELDLEQGDFVAVKEQYPASATTAERARVAGLLEQVRASRGPFSHEVRIVTGDGTVVLLKAEARIIADGEGLETADAKSSPGALQLMQAAARVAERERLKLVADIHDDPLQVMASTDIRLETLSRRITDPHDCDLVASVQRTMREATERLRSLLFDLSPPRLAEEGLGRALCCYARECLDESVECSVRDLTEKQPDPAAAITIFRIVQEALVNVRKHARAAKVQITIQERDGGIAVSVRDDGKGFVPQEADPKHLGIQLMRERAEMAGGRLRLKTVPGKGTELDFWVRDGDG